MIITNILPAMALNDVNYSVERYSGTQSYYYRVDGYFSS